MHHAFRILGIIVCVTCAISSTSGWAEPPAELRPWLGAAQAWTRDTDRPVLSLGEPGDFDDTHIFAPAVLREAAEYRLWYCGSTGVVANRVFHLGMASGRDGRSFERQAENPVFKFGDGKHSILTPTLLREGEQLRMWFSSTWFEGGKGKHTLHETSSEDGVTWSPPSAALLDDVYAPSILKTGQQYQIWYVDVSAEPWIFRHGTSADGRTWRVDPEPCLVIDQKWEKSRLFYPTVTQWGDVLLMWYGSYWSARPQTTALGFAASVDGLKWYKHPQNPVLRPDPARPWESHYVTSQSVARLPDGSIRIWYASRKQPPFVNKYFAINTAVWKDPPQPLPAKREQPDARRN